MTKRRQRPVKSGNMMSHIGLGITFLINAATIGYTWGVTSSRITQGEVNITRIERRIDAFESMSGRLVAVETELKAIGASLIRLERALTDRRSSLR